MANEKLISTAALIAKFEQALNEKWGYIWGTAGEMWTEAKQAELEKTTDSDRAMGREYGSKWIGHRVADCSGLFSWAFKQLAGYMYHGSNTMWNEYCSAKGELRNGKRTDGQELLPGTAVFTYNKSKGNRGHVGLYIGNGWVIEAQGTKAGVVRSRITMDKWVEWGELKGVDYGRAAQEPTSPAEPAQTPAKDQTGAKPTLKRGSKGEYVTLLQTKLIKKGYDLGKWGADGDFGAQTEKAVREYQQDHDLAADGVVGPGTWASLDQQGTNLYTVTIEHLPKYQAEALLKKYDGCTTMKEEGR